MEVGLVVLDGEQVVGLGIDNRLGDVVLASHRVDGDQSTSQGQGLEQVGDGRDLVGLLVSGELPQHQRVVHDESAHDVDGGQSPTCRAAHGLAVDRDVQFRHLVRDRLRPSGKSLAKRLGVEGREDTAKRVGAGHAGRQVEEGGEPSLPHPRPLVHVLPASGAAEHREHGDGDDRQQGVVGVGDAARVFEVAEEGREGEHTEERKEAGEEGKGNQKLMCLQNSLMRCAGPGRGGRRRDHGGRGIDRGVLGASSLGLLGRRERPA